jgi:hypothetical protein
MMGDMSFIFENVKCFFAGMVGVAGTPVSHGYYTRRFRHLSILQENVA